MKLPAPEVSVLVKSACVAGVWGSAPLGVQRNAKHVVVRVGVGIALDKNSRVNFDVKKLYTDTNIKRSGHGRRFKQQCRFPRGGLAAMRAIRSSQVACLLLRAGLPSRSLGDT